MRKMIPEKKIEPIRTKKEYKEALLLVDKYFNAKANTEEGKILETLSAYVEKYEEKHFPIRV